MSFARVWLATAACALLGAALVACSGNLGSGTSGPVPLASLGPGGGVASPTPTPNNSSVVLTYGENTSFQNLPEVGGFSGAIAFPKATPPTPAPKSTAVPTIEPVAIGAKLWSVKPDDGPDLNFVSGKGKKRRTRELSARAVAYVELLPTHDVTMESYPRIALDVPRDLASQYRDGEFGLALWNSGTKDSAYRLAVAEVDTASPPPIVRASAAPLATMSAPPSVAASAPASPLPSASPSASGSPRPLGSGVLAAPPSAAATLPPQRLLFAGTATTFKLVANRPVIFALYALPRPSASGAPSASASSASSSKSAAPSAAASSTPSAATSPNAAASSSPAPRGT